MLRANVNLLFRVGVAIFLFGPVSAAVYRQQHETGLAEERRVHGLDTAYDQVAGGECVGILRHIEDLRRRGIVGESFNLAAVLQTRGHEKCDTTISVLASSFDINPKDPQKVRVTDTESTVWWNLTPKTPGDQQILITTGGQYRKLGFVIVEAGLVPEWASLVASIACSVLGPLLTLPFWMERREKRREKERQMEAELQKTEEHENRPRIIVS